jgi:hypothetical protein
MILETLSLTVRPQSSGEPDAGKPPVRFGGRGDFNTVVPTPILHSVPSGQHGFAASKYLSFKRLLVHFHIPWGQPRVKTARGCPALTGQVFRGSEFEVLSFTF